MEYIEFFRSGVVLLSFRWHNSDLSVVEGFEASYMLNGYNKRFIFSVVPFI
jgi:hypothetical protein